MSTAVIVWAVIGAVAALILGGITLDVYSKENVKRIKKAWIIYGVIFGPFVVRLWVEALLS